jgi:SNF2 family DNA or RNA helicase
MTDCLTNNEEATAEPVPPGLRLLPHQQEGIRFAINRLRTSHGAMFGDVMGLGKTIEAIVTGECHGAQPHLGDMSSERFAHMAA